MLFPTVTIKGRHYMAGGILSHLNATAAPPTDVLLVLSCHPLGSQGAGVDRALAASAATSDAELAQLRETRRLVAVEPDFSHIEAPANLMDPNFAIQRPGTGRTVPRTGHPPPACIRPVAGARPRMTCSFSGRRKRPLRRAFVVLYAIRARPEDLISLTGLLPGLWHK
jgi:hypothetical protein